MPKLSYRAFRPFKIFPGCRTFSHSIQKFNMTCQKILDRSKISQPMRTNLLRSILKGWICTSLDVMTSVIQLHLIVSCKSVLSISFRVDVPTGKVRGSLLFECRLLFERQRRKLPRGVCGHSLRVAELRRKKEKTLISYDV